MYAEPFIDIGAEFSLPEMACSGWKNRPPYASAGGR